MRKLLFLILAVAWIPLHLLAGQADTKKVFPYPIHQKMLPNGLNVVTVPFDSPGLAAFYIIVRVGSREEVEPGKTGFAHFFEHMMFRGTDKYSKEQYADLLKSTGAGANANTWLDRTVYHMTGNAAMLDVMFELEADRFQNLKYSVGDFKTEAGAVKGEYTKNFASPYTQLNEKIQDRAFDKHTYKHTTMGFFEDIVDMPNQFEYSLLFFDRWYRPEFTTILVVGDVKAESVNNMAVKYFGNWKRGTHSVQIPVEPPQTDTRFCHVKMPNFPPVVSMNFKTTGYDDKNPDMAALQVLSSVLFSEKSSLYNKLVISEQKARSLSGWVFNTRDPYLFNINASLVKQDDMQYVKNEIIRTIEEAKTTPVDARVLADTKSNLLYGFAMRIDNPDAIANALSSYIWVTGNPESINTAYAMIENVTADDLMRAARKYFTNNNLTVGTISPNDKGGIQ
jgi:zinc protease